MTPFSKWKTIGYATAIFLTGGISGGALGVYETKSQLFAPPREQEMIIRIRNRLQARLGLTPDQMARINPVIAGAASDIHAIRLETARRVGKVFDDTYAQVSAILTPEQRAKFAQMQKERHEMMERHWQEGHGHPDGPGDADHDRPAGYSPIPVSAP